MISAMSMQVGYRKRIPYPFERVLAQYFDLEHFETVHPRTLGHCRVLEVVGKRILFEQRWPSWMGVRLRTVIEQVWLPPDRIRIRFLRGFLRGVAVSTHLTTSDEETLIEEVYRLPVIPDWSWLRPLVGRVVETGAGHIWQEDLAVELCHGGWPGVPEQDLTIAGRAESYDPYRTGDRPRWLRVAEQAEVAEGRPRTVEIAGRTVVLWRHQGRLHALDNRCPHTGGPLSLGWVEDDCVVCPWHGSRFMLDSGRPCGGPAEESVTAYPARFNGGGILIQFPGVSGSVDQRDQ